MRVAENKVFIEGILAENDIKKGSYQKDGKTIETIGGTLKVLVEQKINDEMKSLEIPVVLFAGKYKNDGGLNPAYTGIETVMKEYVSIAAAGGKEGATKVRISSGKISQNEYFNQDGKFISFPRIQASFVNRVTGELNPKAEFTSEFVVDNIYPAVDKDGIELEPKKLIVSAIIPQYGDKVDRVELVAYNPNVINAIENYWEKGKTFKASGKLNFSSTTETFYTEVDFGEPIEKTRTITVSELVVTGGSQAPLEGDFEFSAEEINEALAKRKEYLTQLKEKPAANHGQKSAPAPASVSTKPAFDSSDLGF